MCNFLLHKQKMMPSEYSHPSYVLDETSNDHMLLQKRNAMQSKVMRLQSKQLFLKSQMGSLMIYFYTNLKFTISSMIERAHDNIIVIFNSMVTNTATTTFAVAITINELN